MGPRLLIVFISAALAIVAACGGTQPINNTVAININAPPKTPAPTATIDELASGKKVFESNCIACHKADGTGGRVTIEGKTLNVENLTEDKIKNMSDEKIIGYVMNGVEDEGMPAFKDKLSEGEMRDVVRYVRQLQGKS